MQQNLTTDYPIIYTVIYRHFSRISSFNGTSVSQHGNSIKNNENTSNEYSNINDNNSHLNRNSNSLLSTNKISKNSIKDNKDNTSLFEKLNSSVNLKRSATTY